MEEQVLAGRPAQAVQPPDPLGTDSLLKQVELGLNEQLPLEKLKMAQIEAEHSNSLAELQPEATQVLLLERARPPLQYLHCSVPLIVSQ